MSKYRGLRQPFVVWYAFWVVCWVSVAASSGMAQDKYKNIMRFDEVAFTDLPGWTGDNHSQAFAAFRKSCPALIKASTAGEANGTGTFYRNLAQICRRALNIPTSLPPDAARIFFQTYFTPYEVKTRSGVGKLTGYYEPELKGSLTKTARYRVPVYRLPSDLVQIKGGRMRRLARAGGLDGKLSWARLHDGRLEPYATRKQIEKGYLRGRGLELLYLEDPVDAFFMHVQGSGRIALAEGGYMRIGFAGKKWLSLQLHRQIPDQAGKTKTAPGHHAIHQEMDAPGPGNGNAADVGKPIFHFLPRDSRSRWE